MLCEGTRRQRGDLAVMLLVHYKDDPNKLAKIMEKLLDRQVHPLYKAPLLSSFYTNNPTPMGQSCSSSRQMRQRREGIEAGAAAVSLDSNSPPHGTGGSQASGGATASGTAREQSPTWEEDYAQWQAGHGARLESKNGEQSSANEQANSQRHAMSVARHRSCLAYRSQRQPGPGSDSGSSGSGKSSGSDSFGSRGPMNHPPPPNCAGVASSLSEGSMGPGGNISLPTNLTGRHPQQASIPEMGGPLSGGASFSRNAGGMGACGGKINRFKNKRLYPSVPNQPSEASAHFMFELAKTVLLKAGGNSSTSLFTQPINSQNPRGPIRALQMCAFQIGLYALGLHNCVSAKWLSRTYSSHVSWITGNSVWTEFLTFMCNNVLILCHRSSNGNRLASALVSD